MILYHLQTMLIVTTIGLITMFSGIMFGQLIAALLGL